MHQARIVYCFVQAAQTRPMFGNVWSESSYDRAVKQPIQYGMFLTLLAQRSLLLKWKQKNSPAHLKLLKDVMKHY